MKSEKLLDEIATLIEVDRAELKGSFDIKGHNLDSLVIVSLIAVIDIIYSVRVQGREIELCETIDDIFKLIELKTRLI